MRTSVNRKEKRYIINRISGFLSSLISVIFWIMLIFGFEEFSMAVLTVIAAGIHEMGHLIYLKCIGVDCGIWGVLSGFRIKPKANMSYREEIWLYLSGPCANLICAIMLSFFIPVTNGLLAETVLVNGITALSNLMPIEGYDGYGALIAFLRKCEIGGRWERVVKGLSCLLIFLLCIISLYFIDRFGGGYWIFAIFFASMLRELSKRLDRIKKGEFVRF